MAKISVFSPDGTLLTQTDDNNIANNNCDYIGGGQFYLGNNKFLRLCSIAAGAGKGVERVINTSVDDFCHGVTCLQDLTVHEDNIGDGYKSDFVYMFHSVEP